jgi:hypothetical protein
VKGGLPGRCGRIIDLFALCTGYRQREFHSDAAPSSLWTVVRVWPTLRFWSGSRFKAGAGQSTRAQWSPSFRLATAPRTVSRFLIALCQKRREKAASKSSY